MFKLDIRYEIMNEPVEKPQKIKVPKKKRNADKSYSRYDGKITFFPIGLIAHIFPQNGVYGR